MKIEVLSSSTAGQTMQFAASYRVNDTLVIDAGSVGFTKLDVQRQIRHVVLSHGHMDHVCSLPIFIDSHCGGSGDPPTIYAGRSVLQSLREHFFNDVLWPDLDRIGKQRNRPFAYFTEIQDCVSTQIDGLRVTPVELDHVVPCFGFVLEESDAAFAIVSDTGPTERIWSRLREVPNLKGVFLEAAVPNSYEWLARQAKHLTPSLFQQEYEKLGLDVPIFAVHLKPNFHDLIVAELKALRLKKLEIAEPNRVYQF